MVLVISTRMLIWFQYCSAGCGLQFPQSPRQSWCLSHDVGFEDDEAFDVGTRDPYIGFY